MKRKSGTENLFTRNVRLFTFLTVVAVFLVGAIALGAYVHGDFDRLFVAEDHRPEMSEAELYALCEHPRAVTGAALSAFKGENYDRKIDGVVVEKYYYVNDIGGRYNLSATERASDARIMYLVLYDTVTKESIDLLDPEARIDEFFGS